MNKLNSIIKQSQEIKDFKVFDVDSEWSQFMDMVGEKESNDIIDIQSKNKSLYFYMMAAAASFILLFAFAITLQPEKKLRESLSAVSNPETLKLVDGSTITLAKGATLDYPLELRHVNERKVFLKGSASFKVTKNILPFTVIYEGLEVKVLGTEFTLEKSNNKVTIINYEGSVSVAEVNNKKNIKILRKGDHFEYENGVFKDLNEIIEEKKEIPAPSQIVPKKVSINVPKETVKPVVAESKAPSGSVYTLGSVLKDHLIKLNKKTLKLDKKFKFDKDQRVRVDLSKSYKEIIESLKTQKKINYKPGECPDCYIIIAPN